MSELIKLRNLYNALNERDNAKANMQKEAERRANATEIGRKYREKEEELNIARKKVNSLVDKIISTTLKISFIATIVIAFILAIVSFSNIGGATKVIDKAMYISFALILASVLMAGFSFCCGMIWIDNKQFSAYFSTLMVCWLIIGGVTWAVFIVMSVIIQGLYGLLALLWPLAIIFMLIIHIFSPQSDIVEMAPLFWRFMLISVIMMVILAILMFLLIKLGERKGKKDSKLKETEAEFSLLKKPYLVEVNKYIEELKPIIYSLQESVNRWRKEVGLFSDKKETIGQILRCMERREAKTIEDAKQWLRTRRHMETVEKNAEDTKIYLENINTGVEEIRKNTEDIKDDTRDIKHNVDSIAKDLSSIKDESKKARKTIDDIYTRRW